MKSEKGTASDSGARDVTNGKDGKDGNPGLVLLAIRDRF